MKNLIDAVDEKVAKKDEEEVEVAVVLCLLSKPVDRKLPIESLLRILGSRLENDLLLRHSKNMVKISHRVDHLSC